jgi:hypothetical protein
MTQKSGMAITTEDTFKSFVNIRLTESDTKPFDLRCRRLGRLFDSPLEACREVVKAILGDGERVRERERDERSEGVESECEVRVKALFGNGRR